MSSAARAPSVDELLGYHLQADVAHDFGAGAPIYNIGGEDAVTRVGASNTSEDGALAFFLDGAGGRIITDLAARKASEMIFTVPDKTASFQNWKAPLLFQGGNDKIGIIQDAGEYITQRIGAKNVIAFGSILDPAGKPVAPDQDPIWFQPTTNQLEIPLAGLGFDPSVIKSVIIKDLTAGNVKASYRIGTNAVIDAVAMPIPSRAVSGGRPKPINNTDVDKAGFFTSIKKVENIDRELVTRGVLPNTAAARQFVRPNLPYFYIGKTLGDAMLVMSAVPKIGAVSNPYSGIGATSGWKSWIDGSARTSPNVLALKTGDRLNWLRAIILNIPTIYEDQAKGGRKIKQYRFFPGLADPAAIRTAILGDFDVIRTDIATRYIDLQTNLGGLLEGTKINKAKTNFAPGGGKEIRSESGAVLAGRLIGEIRSRLGAISKRVTDWVAAQKTKATAIPVANTAALRALYQTTLERANACAPQASDIWIQKGKQDPFLTSKLVVANVPAGVKQGEWPLTTSIDIALRNAFSNLQRADGITNEIYAAKLAGTDIQNRFFAKVNAMRLTGRQRGGNPDDDTAPLMSEEEEVDIPVADVPLNSDSILADVNETVGPTLEFSQDIDDDPTVQKGGAFLTPLLLREESELPEILESFPRTADFLDYLRTKGFEPIRGVVLIYDIIRRRTTNRIVDPVLLDTLMQEFILLLGGNDSTPYVAIRGADMKVFEPTYELPKDTPSSTATVLFDAYTYSVNARNASEFLEGEVTTQSVKDFEDYERAYLAKLETMRTRSGTQLLPAASVVRVGPKNAASSGTTPEQRLKEFQKRSATSREAELARRRLAAQEGGLRARRPLYSNRHGSSRSSRSLDSDDDDARLRKRSGTSATPRVRKHTGNPKTRRQRKSLDRV